MWQFLGTVGCMTRNLVPLLEVPQHRSWISERWLRRLVYERRIPYHKVGGRIFFDLADLDAWAESGRVSAA